MTTWASHIRNILEKNEQEQKKPEIITKVIRPPPGLIPIPQKNFSLFNQQVLPNLTPDSGERPITHNSPFYRIDRPKRIIKPLERQIYPQLDMEINKIKALSIFKRRLIHNILKYFRFHKLFDRRGYIERQMYNNFPNWFFRLNVEGNVINFVPQVPFKIQDNLDYVFNERKCEKKVDFDVKLLTFDAKYIKNITGVTEIVKRQRENHIFFALKTNAGLYKLLPISNLQLAHLRKLYTGPEEKFEEYLAIILARYKLLGGMNNHLSIPPEVYQKIGVQFELFGTPLNVTCDRYCSPFFDVEQYFGSKGSFFNYKMESGIIYGANPPFGADLIKRMAEKIEQELSSKRLERITIYITVPQWHIDFEGYEIIKKSRFLKVEPSRGTELRKSEFPYYHYYKMRYVSAIDSYLLVLSNSEQWLTAGQIKGLWPKGPLIQQKKNNSDLFDFFSDDSDIDSGYSSHDLDSSSESLIL